MNLLSLLVFCSSQNSSIEGSSLSLETEETTIQGVTSLSPATDTNKASENQIKTKHVNLVFLLIKQSTLHCNSSRNVTLSLWQVRAHILAIAMLCV